MNNKKTRSIKKVKWKKVSLKGKNSTNKTLSKKLFPFSFKKARFNINYKGIKGLLKSGHFRVLGLFLFSLLLLMFSVADFEQEKALNPSVKGLSTYQAVNYMPRGSTLLSKDTVNQDVILKYSTTLSPDQINNFYKKFSVLNGWEELEQNTYKCGEGEFKYTISEENDQRVVEYSHCEGHE